MHREAVCGKNLTFFALCSFYLNRPLVMLLEGLGVPYHVFKHYQDEAVKSVNESTKSVNLAGFFLAAMGLGTAFRFPSTLMHLAKLGVSNPTDHFYETALQYARNDALRELKHKCLLPCYWLSNVQLTSDL